MAKKQKFKLCEKCGEPVPRAPGHFQWGIKRAARENLVALQPEKNEIQVDLDGSRAMRQYGKQYNIFEKAGLAKGWREKITPSQTKGHMHVTITAKKDFENVYLQVALAACLGSDLNREAFNLARLMCGQRFPVLFFERDHEVKLEGIRKKVQRRLLPRMVRL